MRLEAMFDELSTRVQRGAADAGLSDGTPDPAAAPAPSGAARGSPRQPLFSRERVDVLSDLKATLDELLPFLVLEAARVAGLPHGGAATGAIRKAPPPGPLPRG